MTLKYRTLVHSLQKCPPWDVSYRFRDMGKGFEGAAKSKFQECGIQ